MTRPPQPQEYGTRPSAQARPRATFTRRFVDPLQRPYEGEVIFRPATGASVTIPVVAGTVEANLVPGDYRMIATLRSVDGVPNYVSENIKIGRYR